MTDGNGDNKFGEYIAYRKAGDHATNMISTLRYGQVTGNGYVINDNLKYKYDNVGNISEVWENGKLSARYAYDKLSRLVREDNRPLNRTYLWTYDNNGNILTKQECAFTTNATDNYKFSVLSFQSYAYDGGHGDRLKGLTVNTLPNNLYSGDAFSGDIACQNNNQTLETGFEYDAIGNPTVYKGKVLEWQKGRQLAAFDAALDGLDLHFTYDGYGRRIKKGNIVYTYAPDGKLLKQSDGENTLEFIYDGDGITGFKHTAPNSAETQYIYRKNIKGDITHIFDLNGNCVVKYFYDAWGNHTVARYDANGAVVVGQPLHIGNLNPFRYRGYYWDTETELYYLQSRYYDPQTGRFINRDDVAMIAPDVINGLNLYAYCVNNPVDYSDPSGHFAIVDDILIGLAIAGILTLCGAAVYEAKTHTLGNTLSSVFDWSISWGGSGSGAYVDSGLGSITGGGSLFIPDWGSIPGDGSLIMPDLGLAPDFGSVIIPDSGLGVVPGSGSFGMPRGGGWGGSIGVPGIASLIIAATLGLSILAFDKGDYGKTVEEILKTRKGSIQRAPFKKNPKGGGPRRGWKELLPWTMAEINREAQKGDPFFKEIWKLLTDNRFLK